jgi:hypothetical protein
VTVDMRIAIIVNPELPLGHLANTVSAIGIGLGAKLQVLGGIQLTDRDRKTLDTSSNLPVPVLQAPPDVIAVAMRRALPMPEGTCVVPFPAYARALHDFAEYQAVFPTRRLDDEQIDGLGLAGPSKWVKSLTGALKLLR